MGFLAIKPVVLTWGVLIYWISSFTNISCVIFTCDDTMFHDDGKAYYIEASNSSHNTNIVYFIVVSMTTEYLEAKKQVKKSLG